MVLMTAAKFTRKKIYRATTTKCSICFSFSFSFFFCAILLDSFCLFLWYKKIEKRERKNTVIADCGAILPQSMLPVSCASTSKNDDSQFERPNSSGLVGFWVVFVKEFYPKKYLFFAPINGLSLSVFHINTSVLLISPIFISLFLFIFSVIFRIFFTVFADGTLNSAHFSNFAWPFICETFSVHFSVFYYCLLFRFTFSPFFPLLHQKLCTVTLYFSEAVQRLALQPVQRSRLITATRAEAMDQCSSAWQYLIWGELRRKTEKQRWIFWWEKWKWLQWLAVYYLFDSVKGTLNWWKMI